MWKLIGPVNEALLLRVEAGLDSMNESRFRSDDKQ